MAQKQGIDLSLNQSRTIFARNPSTDSITHPIKSPRSPTPRTSITPRQAIDTVKLKLTQANDLQHLFEKYMQQIGTHVTTVQAAIDKQFEEIKQEMRKRKNILKQQVEAWKHDKLVAVANEIETAGQYEDILLKAEKQCDAIIKNDKLNQKQKSQQLKQIRSHLRSGLSDVNIAKFKTYNDSKQLAEYINNFTRLIDIEYQQNISVTQLSNYGEIKTNFNNSFLSVPVLNLMPPIKARESKNGYKVKLKWKTSQPLTDDSFIIRCLAVDLDVDVVDEKKQRELAMDAYEQVAMDSNQSKLWKSLIFKMKASNQDKTEFEAFDIETVFSFDKTYKFRIEYHITELVNLLIGSNEQIYEIQNKPPSSAADQQQLIELEYVSSYGNSYEGHAKNLLTQDKSKKYRSKPNKHFGYNENDWIVFKLKHSGCIRTYLPNVVVIKNTLGSQALREFVLSIGEKADGTQWYTYNTIVINENKSQQYQQFLLDGLDWKVVKQMKSQFIKLELTENFGEARGAQCRFKVQEFKLYGVEFK